MTASLFHLTVVILSPRADQLMYSTVSKWTEPYDAKSILPGAGLLPHPLAVGVARPGRKDCLISTH